jgi:two-component system phosphate regulon sensor histidine kinase PhoR
MKSPWPRFFWQLFWLAIICWLISLASEPLYALGTAAVVLLYRYSSQQYQLGCLIRWLEDPLPEKVPHGSGAWDEAFAALYRRFRRQRSSERQLTATLRDFRKAGMALPDGLVILDSQNQVEWCNPNAERHLGLDASRDVGKPVTHIVRHPPFVRLLASEDFSESLTLRSGRAGDPVLSLLIVPYQQDRKLLISRDVTDRERVETMRRDFVANVSHELRTPLTVIGGFLETIADSDAPNAALIRKSVPLMRDQAQRMQHLVEDLLTLSRLETSGRPAREEAVDVPMLTRALYHDALALSGQRHEVRLHTELEEGIAGAEDELRSAFGNLVSNAVRYTPPGGSIDIRWQLSGGDAVFSVQDTGIGIAPEHLPRLTERFYRVDRGRSREQGGTGLGLAIAKHVANRHGAELEILSRQGEGSCFRIRFPASRRCPLSRAPALSSAAGAAIHEDVPQ